MSRADLDNVRDWALAEDCSGPAPWREIVAVCEELEVSRAALAHHKTRDELASQLDRSNGLLKALASATLLTARERARLHDYLMGLGDDCEVYLTPERRRERRDEFRDLGLRLLGERPRS